MINSSLLLTALFSTAVIHEETNSHSHIQRGISVKEESVTDAYDPEYAHNEAHFFIDFACTEFTVHHLSEGHAKAHAFHYAKPRSFTGRLN
jgi:hypothetical protein